MQPQAQRTGYSGNISLSDPFLAPWQRRTNPSCPLACPSRHSGSCIFKILSYPKRRGIHASFSSLFTLNCIIHSPACIMPHRSTSTFQTHHEPATFPPDPLRHQHTPQCPYTLKSAPFPALSPNFHGLQCSIPYAGLTCVIAFLPSPPLFASEKTE